MRRLESRLDRLEAQKRAEDAHVADLIAQLQSGRRLVELHLSDEDLAALRAALGPPNPAFAAWLAQAPDEVLLAVAEEREGWRELVPCDFLTGA